MWGCRHVFLAFASMLVSVNAFAPCRTSFIIPASRTRSFQLSSSEKTTEKTEQEDDAMSFQEAADNILEEENQRRLESMGLGEDYVEEFNQKKDEYDNVRGSIRERASNLGVEKSVATKKAIEEATERVKRRNAGELLDFSAFSSEENLKKITAEPEDELTEEEMKEIDKIGQMPFLDQIREEMKYTNWPSFGTVTKLVAFMFFIFVFTAGFILKSDEFIRNLYTDMGMIPRPDEVYDFSDLQLPEGWLEDGIAGNVDVPQDMSGQISLPPQ